MAKYRKPIQILFSDDQKLQIAECAARSGLTMSEYIRQSAIDREITPIINPKKPVVKKQIVYSSKSQGEVEIIHHLAKIGNNLNQLTRQINTSTKIGESIELTKIATYLYSIEAQITNVLQSIR
jgi:phage FluMu gp28-like protein